MSHQGSLLPAGIKRLNDELDAERDRLRVSRRERQIVIYNILLVYEVTIADMYFSDRVQKMINPNKSVSIINFRTSIDNALCSLVPYLWNHLRDGDKCPTASRQSVKDAIGALHYQIMRNAVLDSIAASRYNLNVVKFEGEKIVIKPNEDLLQKQIESRRKELSWENVAE